jgi:hypothetical protein
MLVIRSENCLSVMSASTVALLPWHFIDVASGQKVEPNMPGNENILKNPYAREQNTRGYFAAPRKFTAGCHIVGSLAV